MELKNVPNMIGRNLTSLGSYFASGVQTLFSGRGGGGGFYPIRAQQPPSARFNWIAEAGDFRQNPVVALGADWIIRNLNSVPLKVCYKTKYGEVVELEEHPLLKLLEKPNPVYSGNALVSAATLDILTVGNGFWCIVPNAGGSAGELYWLDARYMAPDFPVDGSVFLNSWKYIPASTGKPEIFDPSMIVDFKRGVDPWNDRLGYTPLSACVREMSLIAMSAGYTASILKNIGVTNMVISPLGENSLNQAQAEKLKLAIMQSVGMDRQGSPLVLTSPAQVDSLGTTPSEMMLPEVDQAAVARICSAMGLSPMVLGLPDAGKTYANYHEAVKSAWNNSIIPLHELIRASLQDRLMPFYDPTGRMFLKWDYRDVEALAEDQEKLATKAALLFKEGIATRNEARLMVGLDELEDGDVFVSETKPAPAPALINGANNGSNPAEDDPQAEEAEAA